MIIILLIILGLFIWLRLKVVTTKPMQILINCLIGFISILILMLIVIMIIGLFSLLMY